MGKEPTPHAPVSAETVEAIRAVFTNEVIRAIGALARQQNVCREQGGKVVFVTGMEAAREYIAEHAQSVLLSALASERERAEQAERENTQAVAVIHAVDDITRGQATSDFMLSFVPVQAVADLKSERDTLAREVAALRAAGQQAVDFLRACEWNDRTSEHDAIDIAQRLEDVIVEASPCAREGGSVSKYR